MSEHIKEYAFPLDTEFDTTLGLTKRELFAAMAMQGLCANSDVPSGCSELAKFSVEMADALIAELKKEKGK